MRVISQSYRQIARLQECTDNIDKRITSKYTIIISARRGLLSSKHFLHRSESTTPPSLMLEIQTLRDRTPSARFHSEHPSRSGVLTSHLSFKYAGCPQSEMQIMSLASSLPRERLQRRLLFVYYPSRFMGVPLYRAAGGLPPGFLLFFGSFFFFCSGFMVAQ